ncbi:DUF86 domain-containing protein [Candidatus Saganbacteria bacterium]|nr:DUF86 domain-containing protein [Candidatus Saganbacteria bacterium]
MSRKYNTYLNDMLSSIKKIDGYIRGLSLKDFKANEMVVDAVIRNLEILGEASKNIPNDIKKKHKDVEWKKIAGLRDILIHAYFGIDFDILWDILQNKLPGLKQALKKIFA